MGLAARKRRRSIREDALPNTIESADDVGNEVSTAEDEALASLGDEFFDSPQSPVSPHHAPVVPAIPTGKHVIVMNDLPFSLIKLLNANDLLKFCLIVKICKNFANLYGFGSICLCYILNIYYNLSIVFLI